uniref:Flagellar FliJ protein n=1 Tax=Panagrolaimus sp. PS1159 TaxID=55785 RepID=A0AC35GPX7_9BILA
MKTAHLEEVSLLQKRIKYLRINATIPENATTQTDPFIKDSESSGFKSILTQTDEIFQSKTAREKLRLDDLKLAELILEMETEKLNAQNDYKFAVVQIETRMKMEKANEIRRLKEENLKEVEDLSRAHYQQLLAFEEESEKTKMKL